MRKLLATAALIALPSLAMAWDIDKMNETVDQTNFLISGLKDPTTFCSGTLIDLEHRYVLTNAHCMLGVGNDVLMVSQKMYENHSFLGYRSWVVDVKSKNKNFDLMLLQIKDKNIPQTVEAKIYQGDAYVRRGEEIFAVGNPLGVYDATVSKGIISSTTRSLKAYPNPKEQDYFQIDPGTYPGISGGSVYNSNGEIVGIPSAGDRRAPTIGFVIPYTTINEWLGRVAPEIYGKEPKEKSPEPENMKGR